MSTQATWRLGARGTDVAVRITISIPTPHLQEKFVHLSLSITFLRPRPQRQRSEIKMTGKRRSKPTQKALQAAEEQNEQPAAKRPRGRPRKVQLTETEKVNFLMFISCIYL